MKKLLFAVLPVAVALSASAQQKDSVTTKDYARAESFLSYNTFPLVYKAWIDPHWLSNDRFWYANETPQGTEYVSIDPVKGTREVSQQQPVNSTADDKTHSNEVLSPDGRKAAFIQDYNLWVRDITTNQRTQLTTDGVKNYGYATDNAGWKHSNKPILRWSPDSRRASPVTSSRKCGTGSRSGASTTRSASTASRSGW